MHDAIFRLLSHKVIKRNRKKGDTLHGPRHLDLQCSTERGRVGCDEVGGGGRGVMARLGCVEGRWAKLCKGLLMGGLVMTGDLSGGPLFARLQGTHTSPREDGEVIYNCSFSSKHTQIHEGCDYYESETTRT